VDKGDVRGVVKIVGIPTKSIEFSLDGSCFFTTIIDINGDSYYELIVEDGAKTIELIRDAPHFMKTKRYQ